MGLSSVTGSKMNPTSNELSFRFFAHNSVSIEEAWIFRAADPSASLCSGRDDNVSIAL
jgi:hypothetical protein